MSVRRFGTYFLLLALTSVVAFGQWAPNMRHAEQNQSDMAPVGSMMSQTLARHHRHPV